LTQPAQAALYRSVPIAYVWDDHDYGRNDADSTAPSRPAAMQAYRDFVPHYPLATHDSPIYQGFTIGRVRVLITDTRSGRRPADATMLGAEQLGWLEAQLTAAASRFPLVIWVNPDPWIAADDPTADHWGGFEAERTEIAELIGRLELDGLLMLSGDAHMVAIDDGTNNVYAEGARFPVFHAGALDRPGSVKGGPYSAGAYPGGGQFGVVTIRDDGASITVELSGRDWTGEELVHHTFTVPGGDD
jgi:phosphodiesterase/alkaline phosphatase D-like protein